MIFESDLCGYDDVLASVLSENDDIQGKMIFGVSLLAFAKIYLTCLKVLIRCVSFGLGGILCGCVLLK